MLCVLLISCNTEIKQAYELGSEIGITDTINDSTNDGNTEINKRKKWTMVFYMAADNNLETAALNDLQEIIQAQKNTEITYLILLDRCEEYDKRENDWSDTRLLKISDNAEWIDCPELELIKGKPKELNMSLKSTLSGLLSFVVRNYSAEKYGLIIWGHGTGWRSQEEISNVRAIAIDDYSDSYMSISTLREAVSEGMNGVKLDFLGFDTCFAAEIEEACEFMDIAIYFAGRAGVAPFNGWNYKEWLTSIDPNCDDGLIVAKKLENLHLKENVSDFSIIELGKIQNVFNNFENMMKDVSVKIDSQIKQKQIFSLLTDNAISYLAPSQNSYLFIDIYSMSNVLLQMYPSLSFKAELLKQSISDAVVTSEINSHPLGVYFCTVDENGYFIRSVSKDYEKMNNTSWFVNHSEWYVPTVSKNTSVLDLLIYKIFS